MLSDNLISPPTVAWVSDAVELIDQTRLPHHLEVVRCTEVSEVVAAIRSLAVRGAPAIGVAGAYGVALAALRHGVGSPEYSTAVTTLREARPTAVNLARMVDRVHAASTTAAEALAAAHKVRDAELAASQAMGGLGADLLLELCGDRPLRVMTICNTGGLAAVERGTALAVIQTLHERGRLAEALPLETRPLLQGGRLTTWELQRMGAPFRLLVDSAAASVLAGGGVDAVVAGADRIAATGDTANKIGTFALALGADYARVPFVIVAPESTVDMSTPDGAAIEIEDRGPTEVVTVQGQAICPPGIAAINPAFDVTPVALITALVTDQRIIRFRAGERLAQGERLPGSDRPTDYPPEHQPEHHQGAQRT